MCASGSPALTHWPFSTGILVTRPANGVNSRVVALSSQTIRPLRVRIVASGFLEVSTEIALAGGVPGGTSTCSFSTWIGDSSAILDTLWHPNNPNESEAIEMENTDKTRSLALDVSLELGAWCLELGVCSLVRC